MYLRAGALDEFVSRVIDSPKRVPYAYQNEFFDSAHSLSNLIKEFLASLMIDYKDFIYIIDLYFSYNIIFCYKIIPARP